MELWTCPWNYCESQKTLLPSVYFYVNPAKAMLYRSNKCIQLSCDPQYNSVKKALGFSMTIFLNLEQLVMGVCISPMLQ